MRAPLTSMRYMMSMFQFAVESVDWLVKACVGLFIYTVQADHVLSLTCCLQQRA